MSGSSKNSVCVFERSEHLLIERMVDLLPESQLLETVRCHRVVQGMLIVASEPVPDVFNVLLLAHAYLTKLSVGLLLLLQLGSESLELVIAPEELRLDTKEGFRAFCFDCALLLERFNGVLKLLLSFLLRTLAPRIVVCDHVRLRSTFFASFPVLFLPLRV